MIGIIIMIVMSVLTEKEKLLISLLILFAKTVISRALEFSRKPQMA